MLENKFDTLLIFALSSLQSQEGVPSPGAVCDEQDRRSRRYKESARDRECVRSKSKYFGKDKVVPREVSSLLNTFFRRV